MDDFGILFKWKPQTISNRKYSGSIQIFDAMGFALVSLHINILLYYTTALGHTQILVQWTLSTLPFLA